MIPARFKMSEHLEQFLLSDLAGNVMGDRCANDLGLDGRQALQPIFHQRLPDGGKRISVIETEWRQFVTVTANVEHFFEGHFLWNGLLPKPARFVASLVLGLMRCVFCLAKRLVHRQHGFPWHGAQPLFVELVHDGLPRFFFRSDALILWRVATPSLLVSDLFGPTAVCMRKPALTAARRNLAASGFWCMAEL